MVEQKARQCLAMADYGYVLDQGRNRLEGPGPALLQDPEVVRLYLGVRSGRGRAERMTPPEVLDRADVLVIGGGVLGCAAAVPSRRGAAWTWRSSSAGELEPRGVGLERGHAPRPDAREALPAELRPPDLTPAEREHVCATDRLYAEAARDVARPSRRSSGRTSACGATAA